MADDRSAMQELRNILLSREPLYARATAVVDSGRAFGRCRGGAADRCGAPVLQNEARLRPAQRGVLTGVSRSFTGEIAFAASHTN